MISGATVSPSERSSSSPADALHATTPNFSASLGLASYWRFFWPLSLLGLAMLAGRLVQNYVLLDFQDGIRELAAFALAFALYMPFENALMFVPQMTTVLSRSHRSRRKVLVFSLLLGVAFTLPILLIGFSPLGVPVVRAIYDVEPAVVERILGYVRWLTPLIVLTALNGYLTGLLVQSRRTGVMTAMRLVHLGLLTFVLVFGLGRGWSAVTTIALSRLVPELFASAALVVLVRLCHRPLAEADEELTHRRIAAYFLPMALNTVMFALSRPIVFAFVTAAAAGGVLRTGEAAVAGLSLAFSFGMIFQGTINQIRHVFATFGRDDASGVRRFLVHVTVLVTALCLASCISPLNRWYFAHFQGAEGLVLEVALDAMWVLVLVPTVIAWRNYYHGLAMVKRRTLGMGIGGILRNVAIYLACLVLVKLGWFSHFWAAAMLVFGFATEALTVLVLGRGLHRDANRLPSVRPGVAEAGSAAA